MTEVMDSLAKLLLSRVVPGEERISLVSRHMNMTLASDTPARLLSARLLQSDDVQLTMPSSWCSIAPKNVDCTSQDPILIKVAS